MRILYYDWDEFNGEDCRDAMTRLGHEVETLKLDLSGFDLTPEIEQEFKTRFDRKDEAGKRYFDLVYSFDFFPNISEVCQKYDMPYVSWVFDCPHLTLDSHTNANPVNHIYVFDKMLCDRFNKLGVGTVSYSPLGVNVERLTEYCSELDKETGGNIVFQHDVCFLGSLYDNEYNFYDQVKYLPPALKGYTDAVIRSQQSIFGVDFFAEETIFPYSKIQELRQYIKFEETGKYEIDYDEVIRNILRKKVTVNERHDILKEMGKHFDTVIYTNPNAKPIEGVNNLGIASYTEKMPLVFHRSKINLNITLRCITSGVSLRVMDVLAAGGFLLTTYTPEIAEYFVDGEDLAIAYSPEDMIAKTAYYLEHEDERKQIALNGQKKVYENFAYTKLLPDILKF
ncbi:MAG: glycosyltransferase [Butyrivibrio sp.]|nr:glycosyltransferase [Butyrivibrio sp.]MBQ8032021.1 glycosyltransferase [Butyrivibrio sp.]MBR1642982.1 glycosyltransferase [Butyrivibrio sp.]